MAFDRAGRHPAPPSALPFEENPIVTGVGRVEILERVDLDGDLDILYTLRCLFLGDPVLIAPFPDNGERGAQDGVRSEDFWMF